MAGLFQPNVFQPNVFQVYFFTPAGQSPNTGPFNIAQGNSVQFVVEFFDINGLQSFPPSATMEVTYKNTSNAGQVDTVNLAASGSFFTGTWSSTSASLGLATFVAIASPGSVQAVQATTGQLRIIKGLAF